MRTAVKKVRAALDSRTPRVPRTRFPAAIRAIDLAASKGVIKRGTASALGLAPDGRHPALG